MSSLSIDSPQIYGFNGYVYLLYILPFCHHLPPLISPLNALSISRIVEDKVH